jgi:hypothetical protein
MNFYLTAAIVFIFGSVAVVAWFMGLLNLVRFSGVARNYAREHGLKRYWYVPNPTTYEVIEKSEEASALYKKVGRCGVIFICTAVCLPIALIISAVLTGG